MSPAAKISKLVKTHSPDTLIVLDAVCAVASEEIKFDEWGLDVVISATQKGLGVPPGLSVVMASDRAIKVTNARSTPVSSYYINWQRWQPIMQAYEAGQPKYFATRESTFYEFPSSEFIPVFVAFASLLHQVEKLHFQEALKASFVMTGEGPCLILNLAVEHVLGVPSDI